MTNKEIDKAKERLVEIQKIEDRAKRFRALQALAKDVGASTTRTVSTTTKSGMVFGTVISNEITETETVQNIEVALQTATMLNMSKTAAKNYKIAMAAAIAAFVSALTALAAWVAVLARYGQYEN